MRTLIPQQQGKQNDRLYVRSNKRKQSKSPIKFRQKIKQLQQQIQKQKQTNKINLTKEKTFQHHLNNHHQQKIVLSKSPINTLSKQKQVSSTKVSKKTYSLKQKQSFAKTQPKLSKNDKNTPQKPHIQRPIPVKISQKPSLKEQSPISYLQQQNKRYKQIYTKSLQKMQHLQTTLASIKQEHQLQNGVLQQTMHHLKKQVQQKKYHILHAFSYKEENFILLKDKVIAEAENQNSSTLLQNTEFHQKSSFSYLSIQSKGIY